MIDGEPWPAIGLRECLAQVALDPLWLNRRALPPGDGVGLAAGVWPGSKDAAAAMCRVEPDGTVTVVTGMVDMTGTAGAFEAIAAEAMGLSLEAVRVVAADTAAAPLSPVSGGSTVTYSAGRAVRLAALDARDRLLRAAARDLEISLDDLEIVEGTIRPRGAPQLGMTVAEVARRISRREPLEGHATSEHQGTAPSAVAHVAHVRVDLETGVVRPLGHHVVQDVGRAINPALVEGQMQGAAGQAIGWALHEALVYDEGGQLVRWLIPGLLGARSRGRSTARSHDRAGSGARGPVRSQGHRRGRGGAGSGGSRERGRSRSGGQASRAAHDTESRLAGPAGRLMDPCPSINA